MKLQRNISRADRNIAWIERLKITVGDVGAPFLLADFQKQFIRDVYEPESVDDPGKLFVTRGVFSVGRKNGKSELAAALVLLHLIGPESEPNGQIISGATIHRQARIVFEKVTAFIEQTPALKKYLKVSDLKSTISVRPGASKQAAGSRYAAIAAGPGAAQGLDPSLIIMDELAQVTNRRFYDAMIASQKARPQPFMMIISTQNEDSSHVMSTTIDAGLRKIEGAHPCGCPESRACSFCSTTPRTVVHLYAAKEGCDLLDEEQWKAANPALGLWIPFDRFRDEALAVAADPMEEGQFRLYTLNQRVSAESPLMSGVEYQRCAPAPLRAPAIRTQATFGFDKGEKLFGGCDLSARRDLTALTMVSAEREVVHSKTWFWKPAKYLASHGLVDGFDYAAFARQGWIIGTSGETIDPAYVVHKIIELRNDYDILALGYDRDTFRIDEFLRVLAQENVTAQKGEGGGLHIEPWGMGWQSMTASINALHEAVLNDRFRHDGNPILAWNIANAKIDRNPNGINMNVYKIADRYRIDGAITLLTAMGVRSVHLPDVAPVSPWDDPNFTLKRARH